MIEDILGRLPEGVDIPIVRLSLLRLVPRTVRAVLRVRANHRRLPAFLQTAPKRCDALRAQTQSASSPQELAAMWDSEVAPFAHDAFQLLEAAT